MPEDATCIGEWEMELDMPRPTSNSVNLAATAEPPEESPQLRSASQGFTVRPCSALSACQSVNSAGGFVWPIATASASCSHTNAATSRAAMLSCSDGEPQRVGSPATRCVFFAMMGRPPQRAHKRRRLVEAPHLLACPVQVAHDRGVRARSGSPHARERVEESAPADAPLANGVCECGGQSESGIAVGHSVLPHGPTIGPHHAGGTSIVLLLPNGPRRACHRARPSGESR